MEINNAFKIIILLSCFFLTCTFKDYKKSFRGDYKIGGSPGKKERKSGRSR